jgi:hypothetical protein
MITLNESEQTPATIKNHIRQMQKRWNGEVIYVSRQVKSYDRRRLIDRKVSFIVPGNQMYLPLLGLDLREHFNKTRAESKYISPSTQVIIINVLAKRTEQSLTSKDLAESLGYTSMTIIRAFDEIELHELGSSFYKGRERVLLFNLTKRELWDRAQNYMRTPVKKRTWVEYSAKRLPGIQAGLTALAYYSMLAAPVQPVLALSSEYWKKCQRNHAIKELPFPEKNAYDVEIWNYDPASLSSKGVVDPFSLYLSLRNDKDERVQISLRHMMEQIKW